MYTEVLEGRFGHRDVMVSGIAEAWTVPRAARSFGLADDESRYFELDLVEAQRMLVWVLHRDMAHMSEMMPVETARRLADDILDLAIRKAGPGARQFSNRTPADIKEDVFGWNPMTKARFDGGLLVVGTLGSACLWCEDEDYVGLIKPREASRRGPD